MPILDKPYANFIAIALLCSLMTINKTAWGQTPKPCDWCPKFEQNLKDKINQSDAVIYGQVVSHRTIKADDGLYYMSHIVAVYQILKGDFWTDTINVISQGYPDTLILYNDEMAKVYYSETPTQSNNPRFSYGRYPFQNKGQDWLIGNDNDMLFFLKIKDVNTVLPQENKQQFAFLTPDDCVIGTFRIANFLWKSGLCANIQESYLHIEENLAKIAKKIGLNPKNVKKKPTQKNATSNNSEQSIIEVSPQLK